MPVHIYICTHNTDMYCRSLSVCLPQFVMVMLRNRPVRRLSSACDITETPTARFEFFPWLGLNDCLQPAPSGAPMA